MSHITRFNQHLLMKSHIQTPNTKNTIGIQICEACASSNSSQLQIPDADSGLFPLGNQQILEVILAK